MHKIIYNQIDLEAFQLFKFSRRPGLKRSSLRLRQQTGTTHRRRNSFACTVIKYRDRLPFVVASVPDPLNNLYLPLICRLLQVNANAFLCLLAITLKTYFILVLQMLVLLMVLFLLLRCFHVAPQSCPSSREYETSVRSLIS